MRFIKKTALVRAAWVPFDGKPGSANQQSKVNSLFASVKFTNFRFTYGKGYEIFLPDKKLKSEPGDWIVLQSDGTFEVYTAERFQECFEPG